LNAGANDAAVGDGLNTILSAEEEEHDGENGFTGDRSHVVLLGWLLTLCPYLTVVVGLPAVAVVLAEG
jgi:hypothetical protein